MNLNPLRSLAAKLSLLTSLFVLVVIMALSQSIFKQIESGLIGEMRVRAGFFARSSREALFPKVDPFSLHFHVEEMRREKAVTYAVVLDADGKVVSHSDPKLIGDVLDDPVSLAARNASEELLQRRADAVGAVSYDLAFPLTVGTRRIGTARLGFDASSIREALLAQRRRLLAVAAVATGLAILGTVLIVGWVTRPLPRLAAATREIGKGNFDVRVDWRSRDEIGVLAKSFNDMAAANAVLFAAIREEKEKLSTLVTETREGLVWTDPSGRVLLINPSARALLGAEGRDETLQAAATGFEATPRLESVLKGSERITPLELRRADPKLLILSGVADRLGTPQEPAGLLFIFHDATLEKRGEGIARNFISLVSHKLRTPLAVALGYLGILLGDESLNAGQKNALSKINKVEEELRVLVEKLIAFSLVQSPENIILDKSALTPADIVDAALKSLNSLLENPAVHVSCEREKAAALPKITGDEVLLRGVVANLVENAIKFNRGKRKEVSITLAVQDSLLKLSVRDNGPGIPSEEHPKLFRKFYQIDDDFTGQIPGFGLGLAFVKNVAAAHGGSSGLNSTPGSGSEFYVLLPLG